MNRIAIKRMLLDLSRFKILPEHIQSFVTPNFWQTVWMS